MFLILSDFELLFFEVDTFIEITILWFYCITNDDITTLKISSIKIFLTFLLTQFNLYNIIDLNIKKKVGLLWKPKKKKF
jgi:hypothetical protein